jgi:hypothetical protein
MDAYTEEMDSAAAEWLDKIFKLLLPTRVYQRAQHTSYDKYVKNWLLDHEIAIAQEDGVIAVMREGKVFAVWQPPVKSNPKTPTPTATPK